MLHWCIAVWIMRIAARMRCEIEKGTPVRLEQALQHKAAPLWPRGFPALAAPNVDGEHGYEEVHRQRQTSGSESVCGGCPCVRRQRQHVRRHALQYLLRVCV